MSLHPVMQHDWVPAHDGPPLQPVMPLQTLPTHVAPAGHCAPQALQFLGSLDVSTQPLAQHACPGAHDGPPLQPVITLHAPPMHAAPAAHLFPHAPQLPASEVVLVSHPSATRPSQSAKPAVQLPM